jgi:hypothetical protein
MLSRLFEWLQRRCNHPSPAVRADIMEGDDQTRRLQWCLRCGAYRFQYIIGPSAARVGEWKEPRATWAES